MRYKLVYGLFGVSSDGTLKTPNGKHTVKLPKRLAFWLQGILNKKIAYAGMS